MSKVSRDTLYECVNAVLKASADKKATKGDKAKAKADADKASDEFLPDCIHQIAVWRGQID